MLGRDPCQYHQEASSASQALFHVLDVAQHNRGLESFAPRFAEAARDVALLMRTLTLMLLAGHAMPDTAVPMQLINPSETFGDIIIDYSYVELSSAAMTGLAEFREAYPSHRRGEVDRALTRGTKYIEGQQRPDGSWYGSWAVCFTYAAWFGWVPPPSPMPCPARAQALLLWWQPFAGQLTRRTACNDQRDARCACGVCSCAIHTTGGDLLHILVGRHAAWGRARRMPHLGPKLAALRSPFVDLLPCSSAARA